MDWIQLGTFILAAGGLLKQFYDSNIKQKQINKDRLISVTVDERRNIVYYFTQDLGLDFIHPWYKILAFYYIILLI